MVIRILYILLIILCVSCNTKSEYVPIQGQWIKGNEREQLNIIENQFRGFDMAMVEIGYRYQELYWAGQDENWDYADYQLQKIDKAIKQGIERRPKRAASAQHFIDYVIPEVDKAIKTKDTVVFNTNFNMMRNNCISCHTMEKVPSFIVRIPKFRQSPIEN